MAEPLIVGIDIRDLKVAKTGTRTYLFELCYEFKKLKNSSIKFEFLDTSLPIYTGNNKLLKWLGHFQFQLWKQVSLPLKAWLKKCDIVFCTDNFVPLIHLGYKTIPVFHDAFFFETPQNYGKLWLWLYMRTALPAAKRSPFIVTPTYYSKERLQHFIDIADDKLVVITEGARTTNDNNNKPADISTLNLPISYKQYILHVGSFFKRKNIPTLIAAFAKLKADGFEHLKLVLVGSRPINKVENDYQEVLKKIEENNLTNDVILTGYLTTEHLQIIYREALLYVFPSINEGFGLPVLEAFSHNVPVVVANNTCLPEVGGEAVLSFDPYNSDEIASVMKLILEDDALRDNMIKKGRDQLVKFTWQKAAAELIELFKKAAKNS